MAWPLALESGTQASGAARLLGMVAAHALETPAWWGAEIPASLAQQGAPLAR
jgi:hypothetical protein